MAAKKKAQTKAKKATKSAKGNGEKALNDGPLSEDEVEALRKSFHRVLRNKRVAQPVRIQLTTAAGNLRMVWKCKTLDDGTEECGLVEDPG